MAWHLSRAKGGSGGLVLISGEAGIGKSRLVEETLDLAAEQGFYPMTGRCIPGGSRAYLPFEEALEACTRLPCFEQQKDEARSPPGCPGAPTTFLSTRLQATDPGVGSSEKVFFKVLDIIREATKIRPILVVLEDLHWADSSSIQLLTFLARNIRDNQVLLVGTYRSEDLGGEPGGSGELLGQAIGQLGKECLFSEIHLTGIDHEEMAALVTSLVGGRADADVARRVNDDSGGNPLYAIELVQLLMTTSAIVNLNGQWRFIEGAAINVPMTAREIMARRIERIPKKHRRILEYGSVIGNRFDPSLIAEAFDIEEQEVEEALISAQRVHSVVHRAGKCYQFEHDKLRMAIYGGVSRPRIKELHRRLALALEGRPIDESAYGELSRHFKEGGVGDKCAYYSQLAADSCLRRGAWREAIPLYTLVLENADHNCPPTDGAWRAFEGLGDAYKWVGELERAVECYEKLLAQGPTPRDRARILWKEAECWYPPRLGKGTIGRITELLDEAEACGDIELMDEAEILASRVSIEIWKNDFARADEYSTSALKVLRKVGNRERLVLEIINHMVVLRSMGDMRRVSKESLEVIDLVASMDNPFILLHACTNLGAYYVHLGKLEEGHPFFSRCSSICDMLGDHIENSWCSTYEALGDLVAELYDAAQLECHKAQEYAIKAETPYVIIAADSMRSMVEARLDCPIEARRALEHASSFMEGFSWSERSMPRGFVELATAETLWSEGRMEEAKHHYLRSAKSFEGGLNGVLLEATARKMYGTALVSEGLGEEGKAQLKAAQVLFERLENRDQVKRISDLLTALA